MDMDMGMGMGMGGMDMSSSSSFVVTNSALARSYWYIIAGVLSFTVLHQILHATQTRIRKRIARSRSVRYPTKPHNFFSQSYATATAIYREMVSPELRIKNRWVSWLSPPPLGRSLLLATYWAFIIYMLCWQSVVFDAYYLERVAFRAAWVSVTQVPFVYLLASKSSIIGLLSGSSHERLNWLHRWVSRTLLATVTIHGGFFFREWILAGNIGNETFVAFEINLMPMVKYGLGAWSILVWTFLSSLTPIRRLSYELFVLQHLAAAVVFLWLLSVHVPSYAQYNIWFAIAALAFDKVFLFCWSLWENIRIRPARADEGFKAKLIGHHATLRALDDETSEVIIQNLPFRWKPGQHIYLRMPSIGPVESHPFTIANACHASSATNNIRLVVEAQSGFTKRLLRKAQTAPHDGAVGSTAIVTGPFGRPPAWHSFETIVLISASTGASFTIPILQSILSDRENSCVSKLDLLMIVHRRCAADHYLQQLQEATNNAKAIGVILNITIAITGESQQEFADSDPSRAPAGCSCTTTTPPSSSSSTSSAMLSANEKPISKSAFLSSTARELPSCSCGTTKDAMSYTCGRPDLSSFIREPVEASGGETCVAVCGGRSLVACVRNGVVRLSDERAVHKGTGAQGIALHCETYCF